MRIRRQPSPAAGLFRDLNEGHGFSPDARPRNCQRSQTAQYHAAVRVMTNCKPGNDNKNIPVRAVPFAMQQCLIAVRDNNFR